MPSNLNLDYYYGTEADQYSFYRIPKTLLTDPRYKSVSIEAKVLYGLLLDRMGLSVKNNWMDIEKRIYIYFTQEDAMTLIHCVGDLLLRAIPFPRNIKAVLTGRPWCAPQGFPQFAGRL